MSHFTDFTGYVLFIITSFLAVVESTDQCLLNSKVLSCFSGVIMSIRSFFLLSVTEELRKDIPNADQMPLVVADIFATHSVQSLVSIMILSFPDKPSPDKVMNKHPSDSYQSSRCTFLQEMIAGLRCATWR